LERHVLGLQLVKSFTNYPHKFSFQPAIQVCLEMAIKTMSLSVILQTSTKVSPLPVRFCCLVTLCQRLRFILRFCRCID